MKHRTAGMSMMMCMRRMCMRCCAENGMGFQK